MGYLIIIAICATIGGFLAYWEDETIIGILAGGMLGVLLCILAACIISGIADEVEVKTDSQPIYALDNSNGTAGAFFLGSGYVDKEMKYSYLVNDSTKGMQIKTVDVSDAYIKENNKEKPHMVTYTSDFKNPFLKYWFPDMNSSETYTFIIPKGSVKYQYNIDLSK